MTLRKIQLFQRHLSLSISNDMLRYYLKETVRSQYYVPVKTIGSIFDLTAIKVSVQCLRPLQEEQKTINCNDMYSL